VSYAGVEAGSTVAVLGLGPVDQCAVRIAKYLGAEGVIGIDIATERLALTKRYGTEVIDFTVVDNGAEALIDAVDGRGPDATIDVVGMRGPRQSWCRVGPKGHRIRWPSR
jgi:threonine dehydrogenase-like Zn-dependent dehydrogenase